MKTQIERTKEAFLREIYKELEEENVAVFAGSGLSVPAGFVCWKELLKPIADDIGLDIEKEHDLVTLAQYHLNENSHNRNQLNKKLIEEFAVKAEVTENHKILSRLPIHTYWTTNYDKLIENALELAGKIPDVKYTKKQLALTKPKRDAVVYKMHGDIDHPDDTILTKDDYESYHVKMAQYITALSGDLVSKTFIFIGFSFTDPNLDYILSRVRVAYDTSQRTHYCFLKIIEKEDGEGDADFEYRRRKQELFCGDLNRFNIKTILVETYTEITETLSLIEKKLKQNNVFISGAAHEYGKYSVNDSQCFIHSLSQEIIKTNQKIVSGFGLGVGGAVISGALEYIYMNSKSMNDEQLILRPFPQKVFGSKERKEIWTSYRRDMIAYAGIAIFLFGNKLQGDKIVFSDGMREEFEIAKAGNLVLLPIGATGYMAQELWKEYRDVFIDKFKKHKGICKLYDEIGNPDIDLTDLKTKIISALENISNI